MEPTPARSRALPWQAVVAATVLALMAAAAVVFVLSDDGDADVEAGTGGDTSSAFTLVPEDEVTSGNAVDVEFTELDDTTRTISSRLDGRPMVVNFFQSYCPPCIEEMPAFEAVSQELAGQVDFLGLAVQDRLEDATEIVEKTGVTYPWARDVSGDVIAATGSVVMPTTMFVAADGTVEKLHAGALDEDELMDMVRDELGIEP